MKNFDRVDRHLSMVYSIIQLEELVVNNIIPNELVGNVVLVDANKIMMLLESVKRKVTHNFKSELTRKCDSGIYEPLKEAIKVMNNGRKSGGSNEPTSNDDNGETSLGEESKLSPFGGVKIDKD